MDHEVFLDIAQRLPDGNDGPTLVAALCAIVDAVAERRGKLAARRARHATDLASATNNDENERRRLRGTYLEEIEGRKLGWGDRQALRELLDNEAAEERAERVDVAAERLACRAIELLAFIGASRSRLDLGDIVALFSRRLDAMARELRAIASGLAELAAARREGMRIGAELRARLRQMFDDRRCDIWVRGHLLAVLVRLFGEPEVARARGVLLDAAPDRDRRDELFLRHRLVVLVTEETRDIPVVHAALAPRG